MRAQLSIKGGGVKKWNFKKYRGLKICSSRGVRTPLTPPPPLGQVAYCSDFAHVTGRSTIMTLVFLLLYRASHTGLVTMENIQRSDRCWQFDRANWSTKYVGSWHRLVNVALIPRFLDAGWRGWPPRFHTLVTCAHRVVWCGFGIFPSTSSVILSDCGRAAARSR